MDIGNKLQQSRTQAGLTQEQVAEALSISRQTISNWENEKTYPDIRIVIILSDLYQVSLDYLLKGKEEPVVSDYLDYLEESTNTVKSKNKFSKLLLLLTYLLIWAISLIAFWFFTDGSDAMGYSIMYLWIVLPVTTLIVSILIGNNNYWGKAKWFSSFVMGILYMLAEYATFSAANMTAFHKINSPEWSLLVIGTIISLIGLIIGNIARKLNFHNTDSQSQ